MGLHLALTSEWDDVKWRPLTTAPSLVGRDGFSTASFKLATSPFSVPTSDFIVEPLDEALFEASYR